MGFFSSCDHNWSQFTKVGGFWKATTDYHKCTKCGAEEKCNSDDGEPSNSDGWRVKCSKCGCEVSSGNC